MMDHSEGVQRRQILGSAQYETRTENSTLPPEAHKRLVESFRPQAPPSRWVGWILKWAADRAGLKPEPLGGHSLRAGHVTQAAMNGISERDIMRQTGHKSAEMLARYIRIGEIFTRNAAAGLGI